MRYDSIFCNKHQDQNETQGKFPWKGPQQELPRLHGLPLTHKSQARYAHVPLTPSSASSTASFPAIYGWSVAKRAEIMKECNGLPTISVSFKMEAWYKLATGGKSHLVINYSTRPLLCKFCQKGHKPGRLQTVTQDRDILKRCLLLLHCAVRVLSFMGLASTAPSSSLPPGHSLHSTRKGSYLRFWSFLLLLSSTCLKFEELNLLILQTVLCSGHWDVWYFPVIGQDVAVTYVNFMPQLQIKDRH